MQHSQDDQKSDYSRGVPKREIPVLPRRATPSNVRSKSSDVRNILFTNQPQTEIKNHAINAITRYEKAKVRSIHTIGN